MNKLTGILLLAGIAALPSAVEAADGQAVYMKNGCIACHTIEGKGGKVGPSLDGLGKKGNDFIRESIVDPNKTVTQGFAPNIMPKDFGTKIKKDEMDALVEWLAKH